MLLSKILIMPIKYLLFLLTRWELQCLVFIFKQYFNWLLQSSTLSLWPLSISLKLRICITILQGGGFWILRSLWHIKWHGFETDWVPYRYSNVHTPDQCRPIEEQSRYPHPPQVKCWPKVEPWASHFLSYQHWRRSVPLIKYKLQLMFW